jgi:hypothetical protein
MSACGKAVFSNVYWANTKKNGYNSRAVMNREKENKGLKSSKIFVFAIFDMSRLTL